MTEWNKWLRLIFCLCAIKFMLLSITGHILDEYHSYQANKGKAISNYLTYYHNIDIRPEDAAYFDANITTWDISVDSLDIFPTTIKGGK